MLTPAFPEVGGIFSEREKRAVYSPDKEHIHHKLLALGLGLSLMLLLMEKRAWPVGLILVTLGLGYLASHWLTGRRGASGAPTR